MKRFLIPLMIAVVVACAFTIFAADRQVALDAHVSRSGQTVTSLAGRMPSLERPLALEAATYDHVRLTLNGTGYAYLGVLTITGRGPAPEISYRTASAERIESISCEISTVNGDTWSCRLPLGVDTIGPTRLLLSPVANSQTKITQLTFDVVNAKRTTSAAMFEIICGFLLLLVLGPLIYRIGRWPRIEPWVVTGLGLAWIAIASAEGMVAIALFTLAGYGGVALVAHSPRGRKRVFYTAVSMTVLLLVFIKFVAPLVADSFANPGGFALALPLGISYVAIRIIDLLITAHSGQLTGLSPMRFAAFMLFPNTLPAGPIFTYEQFQKSRIQNYNVVILASGGARVFVGITKKMVADLFVLPLVLVNRSEFLLHGDETPDGVIAAMLLTNVLYVWMDFSAYCDLAIGSARAAGRTVPENFNWPLLRSGIQKFWRHWHMTLSNWVMRRVYFPFFLSSRMIWLSTFASMLTIGLWHSPTLSWTLWALHHSAAMALEQRYKPFDPVHGAPRWLNAIRFGSGIIFVWIWVALGHSFTQFSSPSYALEAYIGFIASGFGLAAFL